MLPHMNATHDGMMEFGFLLLLGWLDAKMNITLSIPLKCTAYTRCSLSQSIVLNISHSFSLGALS